MAEGYPSLVTGRIIELLRSAEMMEIGSLQGVGKELSKLSDTVLRIHPVLVEMEAVHSRPNSDKDLLERLEDAIYEADDLLDSIFTAGMRRGLVLLDEEEEEKRNKLAKQVRVFFSLSPFKMRREIRKIKAKLDKIVAGDGRFCSQNSGKKTQPGSFSVTVSEGEEETSRVGPMEWNLTNLRVKLTGREADKEEIVKRLLGSEFQEEGVSVVPIYGLGGVGKTYLAREIFMDERVQNHFDMKMWVTLGQDFVLREIVRRIITSATNVMPANLEMDQLQIDLRKEIDGRRYLLVLDDMWSSGDANAWGSLKNLLESRQKGSKVLVTTRIRQIAESICTIKPYKLNTLDTNSSWLLFSRLAFKTGQPEPELQQIATKIVKKCQGMPIAIVALAGSLQFSRSVEEWSRALKQLTSVGQTDNILNVLRISYINLPLYLKHCFAYLRLFPEDHEFDVQTLNNIWMSQGFTESLHLGTFVEDLEEDCVKKLLLLYFLQRGVVDEWGNITTCTIHDLLHDLAISVSGAVCNTLCSKQTTCDRRTRHFSFVFHLDSPWQIPIPNLLVQAKRTRSVILPLQLQKEMDGRSSNSICETIILKFKYLRTLDLHNSGIKTVPNSVGKLKHLRYLDLSQNVNVERLPNCICKLWNLQTLKLNHCAKLQELPRDIRKLVNLRNLEIDSCYNLTHMPQGLGQLTGLSTLSEFVLGKVTRSVSRNVGELNELEKLNNLRGQLRIKNLRLVRDASSAKVLHGKKHLRSLILSWDALACAGIDATGATQYKALLQALEPHPDLKELSLFSYGGVEFPKWLPLHKNLVKFSLWSCVRCQHLPPLNHLPHLKVLVLEELTNLEYISECTKNESTAFFESLNELRLTNLPKLKGWWNGVVNVEETIFPSLSKLIIEDCPFLNSLPLYPNVEELLVLKNTPWESFKNTIVRQQIDSTTTTEASSSSTSSSVSLSKLRTLCIIHMSNGDLNMWKSLQSLRSVTFDHLQNIEPLLQGLQLVTSLQELHIWRCDALKKLPEWITGNKSLQKLSIRLCPNLKVPLDNINLFSSSKKVEIEDCPLMAHIENLLKHQLSQA